MVTLFFDAALPRAEGIVIFAAAPGAHPEAVAELDALHRADTHDRLCELCVELIKDRFAEPREHSGDAAAHRAAERISGLHHFFQVFRCPHSRFRIRHAERVFRTDRFVKGRCLDFTDRAHIGEGADAEFREELCSNRAADYPSYGLPPRASAAAPRIPETEFLIEAEVRVPRAVAVPNGLIVRRVLVFIAHQNRNRCAEGLSFKDTGQNFAGIRLLTGRRERRLPGLSPV